MAFQEGDRVELVEISGGKKITGGFEVGQTGTVIGEIAKDYPIVTWDKAIIPKTEPDTRITKSNCDAKTLKKL
ncbi:hypothetical protein [Nostoc sp. NMS4]|uniref:hypothetical protein n=1 Tax=Nostoc sp. NMS4 TaxID=2815390 RepID=UPI0025EC35B9|nr:hypothetical protein [Nostoc sp. NMS4]MBN3927177.1 hypothetical protein [Nostoc sp. NMS4]